MLSYNDSSHFQKGLMQNDTGMDTENALTAVKPEETRCGSLAVAAGAVGGETGGFEKTEGVEYGSH